jgi:hypothetical protein
MPRTTRPHRRTGKTFGPACARSLGIDLPHNRWCEAQHARALSGRCPPIAQAHRTIGSAEGARSRPDAARSRSGCARLRSGRARSRFTCARAPFTCAQSRLHRGRSRPRFAQSRVPDCRRRVRTIRLRSPAGRSQVSLGGRNRALPLRGGRKRGHHSFRRAEKGTSLI